MSGQNADPGRPSSDAGFPPSGAGREPGRGQAYGQRPYGQQPYGQQPYGQQPYGSPGYGPPPGHAQQPYGPPGHGPPGTPGQDPTDCIGARVGQYLLDGLLVAVPVVVVLIVVGSIVGVAVSSSSDPSGAVGLVLLLYFLVFVVSIGGALLVHAYWPSKHGGQTPAMGWLGLRCVREEDGGVPTLGQFVVRYLLLVVDGVLGGVVGLIIMSTSERHQRLGDQVARTLVVRA